MMIARMEEAKVSSRNKSEEDEIFKLGVQELAASQKKVWHKMHEARARRLWGARNAHRHVAETVPRSEIPLYEKINNLRCAPTWASWDGEGDDEEDDDEDDKDDGEEDDEQDDAGEAEGLSRDRTREATVYSDDDGSEESYGRSGYSDSAEDEDDYSDTWDGDGAGSTEDDDGRDAFDLGYI